ncbi:hypothetical protein [Altererythrobacter sp. MF3-039]|uniref:hypothetical protein n=1 Tax=Altererythrobacter sp. MF3-039 TaxID=3252901 RepID=UPI00390CA5FC
MSNSQFECHDRERQRPLANLIRFGAFAAILGGSLGAITPIIGHQPQSIPHEALYAVIDARLLFGTIAIWLTCSERLGMIGLMGFIVALTGIASIIGPEPQWVGIDLYWIGSIVFALGVSILAVQILRHGPYEGTAVIWIIAVGIGAIGALFPEFIPSEMAGPIFKTGFLVAGVQILRTGKSQPPNASTARLEHQHGGGNAT